MKRRNVRLDSSLPSVNEDMLYDVNAFPAVPFTYLSLRGAHVRQQIYYACFQCTYPLKVNYFFVNAKF